MVQIVEAVLFEARAAQHADGVGFREFQDGVAQTDERLLGLVHLSVEVVGLRHGEADGLELVEHFHVVNVLGAHRPAERLLVNFFAHRLLVGGLGDDIRTIDAFEQIEIGGMLRGRHLPAGIKFVGAAAHNCSVT